MLSSFFGIVQCVLRLPDVVYNGDHVGLGTFLDFRR